MRKRQEVQEVLHDELVGGGSTIKTKVDGRAAVDGAYVAEYLKAKR